MDDQIPQLPLLFPDNTFKGETTTFSPIAHPYNTRSRTKTAAVCRQAVVETQNYTFVICDTSIPCYIRHMCSFDISYFT